MNIYSLLTTLNIPVAYMKFSDDEAVDEPPYIVYRGNGQDAFKADDTIYRKNNNYIIEYYFKLKNEETENTLENLLISNGYIYEKSEDIYLNDSDIAMIYYYI